MESGGVSNATLSPLPAAKADPLETARAPIHGSSERAAVCPAAADAQRLTSAARSVAEFAVAVARQLGIHSFSATCKTDCGLSSCDVRALGR
jgi:hypothetical protein